MTIQDGSLVVEERPDPVAAWRGAGCLCRSGRKIPCTSMFTTQMIAAAPTVVQKPLTSKGDTILSVIQSMNALMKRRTMPMESIAFQKCRVCIWYATSFSMPTILPPLISWKTCPPNCAL
mgnify:CR=1 FL=1